MEDGGEGGVGGGEWGWRRMRRIEALTDRSQKYKAFSKAALVREIVLSLIRLRTVSSRQIRRITREFMCFLARGEKRAKGERYTDSSYTTDSHANTGLHGFYCQE